MMESIVHFEWREEHGGLLYVHTYMQYAGEEPTIILIGD